jgi:hypothetical protein
LLNHCPFYLIERAVAYSAPAKFKCQRAQAKHIIETFVAIFWITELLSIARAVEYSALGKVSESPGKKYD